MYIINVMHSTVMYNVFKIILCIFMHMHTYVNCVTRNTVYVYIIIYIFIYSTV